MLLNQCRLSGRACAPGQTQQHVPFVVTLFIVTTMYAESIDRQFDFLEIEASARPRTARVAIDAR